MKVYQDISLDEFKPWGGAVPRFENAKERGLLEEIEAMFDEFYPEGVDETTLNDWFWFDYDDYREEKEKE